MKELACKTLTVVELLMDLSVVPQRGLMLRQSWLLPSPHLSLLCCSAVFWGVGVPPSPAVLEALIGGCCNHSQTQDRCLIQDTSAPSPSTCWAHPDPPLQGSPFSQAPEGSVTTDTDCLVLPNPSFPVSMSSVEWHQEISAVPAGLSQLLRPRLMSPFPLENLEVFLHPAVITNTPGSGSLHMFDHLQSSLLLHMYLVPGRVFPYGQPGTIPTLWLGEALGVQGGSWAGSAGCGAQGSWCSTSCSPRLLQNLCSTIPSILPMPKWVSHGLDSSPSCWRPQNLHTPWEIMVWESLLQLFAF